MHSRRTRSRALAAAALAPLLLLTGCTGIFDLLTPAETSTPTGEDVEDELRPYFEQSIVWRACGNDAQCATVKAPLDWENPSPDTDIELALTRHRALDGDPQGSLFFNPGGPGASGVDFVKNSPEGVVSEEVRSDFDLVGWDPRGVGSSSAVVCYTDPKDFDEFLFGIPEGEPGSAEWIADVERAGEDFVDACAENTGELLGFIDTLSTVRDLDLLRALVGDEKLNYFGMSYGTQIGAQYADLFPEKVGRMVLDAVVNPAETMYERILGQTEGFDRALRNYLQNCRETACPFTEDPDTDIQVIADLYDRLDESPLPHDDGRMLSAGVLDTAISAALYEERYWPILSQAFQEIALGETDTTFALADAYFQRVDGEYEGHFFESFYAITCIDHPSETDPAELERQVEELNRISPLEGDVPIADPVCTNWPYPPRDIVGPVEGKGADPILLIGTTGDPATPYESAVEVAEQLESGVLISYDGDDHIAYDEGDPCVNTLVDDYLLTGAVPDEDFRCGF
ncbi:alpha/beta hydrolase [Lysobacter korlensis]|uniref:Alpha/beta hydrolase n=1 Tax=Lysobacter korlensis TaxID=553636 RepID=A0ABV6RYC8_9GAMM